MCKTCRKCWTRRLLHTRTPKALWRRPTATEISWKQGTHGTLCPMFALLHCHVSPKVLLWHAANTIISNNYLIYHYVLQEEVEYADLMTVAWTLCAVAMTGSSANCISVLLLAAMQFKAFVAKFNLLSDHLLCGTMFVACNQHRQMALGEPPASFLATAGLMSWRPMLPMASPLQHPFRALP